MTPHENATADKIINRVAAYPHRAFKGTREQFAQEFGLNLEEVGHLTAMGFQQRLHVNGIEVWTSRDDRYIRLVHITRQRLFCAYCSLPEPESELTTCQGHRVHRRCRAAFMKEFHRE